jgi:uncharacterized protein (DUF58 family)
MIRHGLPAALRWLVAALPLASRWLMAAGLAFLLPLVGLPYLLISIALLALRLSLIPGRSAPYELFVALLNTVGLPFVAGSVWPLARPGLVLLLVLPGLVWLAASLQRAAASIVWGSAPAPLHAVSALPLPGGRTMTTYAVALTAGLLIQALVGAVAGQAILLWTALIVLGFLWILLVISRALIPSVFVTVSTPTVRVLAGHAVDATVSISSRARLDIGILLEEPFEWSRISPRGFAIGREAVRVGVRMTPPLAGPSMVSVRAAAVDPWGLTMVQQEVDLVGLRVVPRAAYAAWLARRFLEQARPGVLAGATVTEAGWRGRVRRGLDYYGARPYEPGDVLRDVFWKHTLKLGELVMKERRDEHGEPVIVAANLSVGDPEAADWLAFRLLMSVLTLAREGVPLAFSAYTADNVISVTPPMAPREAVRHALGLVEAIKITTPPVRVLQPSRVGRLRRNILRLGGSSAEPAARLARILVFEHQALLHRAQGHPVFTALKSAAARMNAPAGVLFISRYSEEAEAMEVAMERLRRRGLRTVHL